MTGLSIPARLVRVEGFCNRWGLDLTVGCRHACAYCHFRKYQALTLRHEYPDQELSASLSVEEFLDRREYPPDLYLSPFTDPLAPAARANLERVLQRVLPLSVKVGISTKGVIPRRVFRLLSRHPDQVRLIIGVTSLDDRRNTVVEPGCPPANARLANLRLAWECGLKKVTARLDPLLPGVDGAPEQLAAVLDRVVAAGAQTVTASYLFVSPSAASTGSGKSRTWGARSATAPNCARSRGMVYSVPLERKRRTYGWFHRECAARGLYFGTCGCKDLRLTGGDFATACTYPYRSGCEAPRLRTARVPREEGGG